MLRLGEVIGAIVILVAVIWASIYLGIGAYRLWKEGRKKDEQDEDARL